MRKLLPVLLTVLLPLAACGDDDPVGPDRSGSLSFTYSGDTSGTYTTKGEVPKIGTVAQNDVAMAMVGTLHNSLTIDAIRFTERPKADVLSIVTRNVTGPKTIPVCGVSNIDCAHASFTMGFNRDIPSNDRLYVFVSGDVTISEFSATRVRGTFQGRAVLIDRTGNRDPNRAITISNGQFDVPIRN